MFFFFKQKTAYEMRISDWSSDVCSSDLQRLFRVADARDFESLESVGEVAWKMHDQPDAGLWEFRTRQLVHTYSAVMSWAACDRLGNVAARIGRRARVKGWNDRAAKIRAPIEREAWSAEQDRKSAGWGKRVAGQVEQRG